MTWLTKLRTYLGHDEELFYNDISDPREVQEALASAKSALDDARKRRDETRKISSRLADLNERNHYGESIMLSMMPREGRQ